MNKILLLTSYLFIMLFAIQSCLHYTDNYSDNPKCKTIVYGKHHYELKWRGKRSIIFVNKTINTAWATGKIISKTDKGYIFEPEKNNKFNLPKRLYEFNEIDCLIDDSAHVVYGTIPKDYLSNWNVVLEAENIDTKYHFSFLLESNKDFAYCVDSGTYQIYSIKFYWKDNTQYLDQVDLTEMFFFEVKPNMFNYIGDFYLDSVETGVGTYKLECEAVQRPSGIIGYALGPSGMKNKFSDDIKHYLTIKDEYIPKTNSIKSKIYRK